MQTTLFQIFSLCYLIKQVISTYLVTCVCEDSSMGLLRMRRGVVRAGIRGGETGPSAAASTLFQWNGGWSFSRPLLARHALPLDQC